MIASPTGKRKMLQEHTSYMEKGHVKLRDRETVHTSTVKIEERPVRITDKLVAMVPVTDTRSDAEIRRERLEKLGLPNLSA